MIVSDGWIPVTVIVTFGAPRTKTDHAPMPVRTQAKGQPSVSFRPEAEGRSGGIWPGMGASLVRSQMSRLRFAALDMTEHAGTGVTCKRQSRLLLTLPRIETARCDMRMGRTRHSDTNLTEVQHEHETHA